MIKINVLTDYRGWLFSSVELYKQKHVVTMNLEKLKQYAQEAGIEFHFMKYSDLDIQRDYSNQFFIYNSSEDSGLIYKSYFEDLLYILKQKGAILIPEWRFMRAHHNKVMMELLRSVDISGVDTGIQSRFYGCLEEFVSDINNVVFPCVYKTAEGAGSNGVALFKNKEQALSFIKKNNINQKPTLKQKVFTLKNNDKPAFHSNYRNKFVIQNFIPGLSGDFKVLVFGDKYYALSRQNRDNDFRASGGGRLNYEPDLPEGIFDFAKSIYDVLNLPVLSLDIAHDGHRFYLIEFQCLHFGTATLEYSTHYYSYIDDTWIRYNESSILEKEYVNSLKRHIIKNYDCDE